MAFPASQQLLVNGLQRAIADAAQLKRLTAQLQILTASGPVNRLALIQHMKLLSRALLDWGQIRTLPGIAEYARDQFGDIGLDIVAEFTAMEAAALDLRDWIFDNFPKDAGGGWLVDSYNRAGTPTPLVFTSVQMDEFRIRAGALVATID